MRWIIPRLPSDIITTQKLKRRPRTRFWPWPFHPWLKQTLKVWLLNKIYNYAVVTHNIIVVDPQKFTWTWVIITWIKIILYSFHFLFSTLADLPWIWIKLLSLSPESSGGIDTCTELSSFFTGKNLVFQTVQNARTPILKIA